MNSAGFAREDIEDARRGVPAFGLAEYAASRGLAFAGSTLFGQFAGLNPRHADYVHNCMRGPFPGDRIGTLANENFAIPIDDGGDTNWGGALWGVRTGSGASLGDVVGLASLKELFGTPDPRRDEPFSKYWLFTPVTAVRVHEPRAVFLPRAIIQRRDTVGLRPRTLGPAAEGFAFRNTCRADDATVAALGAAIGPVLATLGHTFVRVDIADGRIGLTVNGFIGDPAHLDALVHAVCAIADAAADVCRGWWAPGPFDQPLPGYDPAGHPPAWPSSMFDGRFDATLRPAMAEIVGKVGGAFEDPVMFHRRFPTSPLPGAAIAVAGGWLAGCRVPGRLVWFFQHHPKGGSWRRFGAVFPAADGAAPTPIGGVSAGSAEMYLAVQDGLATCWTKESWDTHYHSQAMLERAVRTMRETGAAPV